MGQCTWLHTSRKRNRHRWVCRCLKLNLRFYSRVEAQDNCSRCRYYEEE